MITPWIDLTKKDCPNKITGHPFDTRTILGDMMVTRPFLKFAS